MVLYIVKSSLILAVCYVLYALLQKDDRNFGFNRFFLLASLSAALVVPLLHLNTHLMPQQAQPLFRVLTLPAVTVGTWAESSQAAQSIWPALLTVLYGCVAAFLAVRTAKGLIHTIRFIQTHASDAVQHGSYQAIHTHGLFPTGSFFNYILLDNHGIAEQRDMQQILAHEQAHARLGHTYDLLYLEIICILFWFNPLVWLYRTAVKTQHEFQADDAAVRQTGDQKAFIRTLARQTIHSFQFNLYNQFYSSQTIRRMNMLKSKGRRPALWNIAVIVPSTIMLVVLLGCESGEGPAMTGDVVHQISKNNDDQRMADGSLKDVVVQQADQMPEPAGGMEVFMRHIAREVTYPADAREKGIEGKVLVQFVVDKNGAIRDVKAIRGIGHGCDAEAVRVVQTAPKFNPGVVDQQPVHVQMVVPIVFKLHNGQSDKTEAHEKNDNAL